MPTIGIALLIIVMYIPLVNISDKPHQALILIRLTFEQKPLIIQLKLKLLLVMSYSDLSIECVDSFLSA